MAAKAKPWTKAKQQRIGLAVLLARLGGMRWKELERRFGRSRLQLWRCASLADGLMKQNSRLMKHLRSGGVPAFGLSLSVHDDCRGELVMFGGGSPTPPPVQAPPTLSDPAVAQAARQEQLNSARARGRAATLLTGGMGVTAPAPIAQKQLLGQ